MAAEATRKGKALIPDTPEFYNWASQSTMTDATCLLTRKKCGKQQMFAKLENKYVQKTIKLYAFATHTKKADAVKTVGGRKVYTNN